MFVFAFPGMGKTTLAKTYSEVVDLELSDIKYDNQSVSHLTKEERKSTKRPIKDKNYKKNTQIRPSPCKRRERLSSSPSTFSCVFGCSCWLVAESTSIFLSPTLRSGKSTASAT